jgi:hypothetical protein
MSGIGRQIATDAQDRKGLCLYDYCLWEWKSSSRKRNIAKKAVLIVQYAGHCRYYICFLCLNG